MRPLGGKRITAMRQWLRSEGPGYALSLAFISLAFLLRWSMALYLGDRPLLILFIIPILLSAYSGGLGPGLLAVALAGAGTGHFLRMPADFLAADKRLGPDLAQWLIFLGSGILGCLLVEALHRTRRQSETAAAELRESQRDLNRAQAVAQTGSWRLDVRRNELLWSAETHRIFGIPRGTSMTYEAFLAAVHPDDRELVDTSWKAALLGGPYDIEHRIVAEGKIKWVRERAELELDEQGRLIGGFGTVQDITERKQAEEERERLVADLARSNKELEQFAYVASHDLQEPLRMVASYVQLLEKKYKGKLDEKADTYIHFAVDGAYRMQKLIEGLLEYSRVTRRGARFCPVDVNAVFDGAVSNLTAAIRESSAMVTRDDLHVVSGDETQLTQLFQNLIGNAIKFGTPGKPPLVHVSAKKEGNTYVFSVRDNGIGIDPEYFGRIFMIFQRLHTREEYPGTGIGLALCKRIVARHHGRIWVESAPGKGSTFFFTLPGRLHSEEQKSEK